VCKDKAFFLKTKQKDIFFDKKVEKSKFYLSLLSYCVSFSTKDSLFFCDKQ